MKQSSDDPSLCVTTMQICSIIAISNGDTNLISEMKVEESIIVLIPLQELWKSVRASYENGLKRTKQTKKQIKITLRKSYVLITK